MNSAMTLSSMAWCDDLSVWPSRKYSWMMGEPRLLVMMTMVFSKIHGPLPARP